jgi:ketosteroid isomerase-like protein
MDTTERTRAFITDLFDRIAETGGYGPLLDALSDDLVWTVTGTSPISGVYHGKQGYIDGVFSRLDERLEAWPAAQVEDILADGDTAVVFFTGVDGRGRNGLDYSMRYCWRMRVDDTRISQVTGYYDGIIVNRLFD